jgi:copper resistance protein D
VIDPLILLRWAHFSATALVAGTVLFLVAAAEPALRAAAAGGATFRRSARWIVWSALTVAIASGAGWLVWLASDIYAASLLNVCLHGGAWSVLTETRFGQVWLSRLALALSLGALMRWPGLRLLQLAVACCLLALLAFIGHADASPDDSGNAQLAADILHLLAAGAWIGGLPALTLLLHQARRAGDIASSAAVAATRRFSAIGVAAVGTLLATGAINSWYMLSGPRNLIATDYGRLILFKIGLFAAMIGIAAVNRFHLTPQLAVPTAMRALQRNSLAEIGLGLCVFLFVGALGTMAPPLHDHVHIPTSPIPADAAFVHIHSTDAMADVTIEPGRAGTVYARVLLLREDFSIFTAKNIKFVLTPQAPSTAAAISGNAKRLPDGAWEIDGLEIRQPGIWTIKITIDTGTEKPIVLDAPVVIGR